MIIEAINWQTNTRISMMKKKNESVKIDGFTFKYACPICKDPCAAACNDRVALPFFIMRHYQSVHPGVPIPTTGY
jgi:hypothetical protein